MDILPDSSAGFWIRLGAFAIDSAVVGLASVLMDPLPSLFKALMRLGLGLAYSTIVPIKLNGQTPGKMAAGVAIAREDGQMLTYQNTFLRALGYWASNLTLGGGYLCALFTTHKRALHDYIGGTRVVRVQEISSMRKAIVILVGVVFSLILLTAVAAVALKLSGAAD